MQKITSENRNINILLLISILITLSCWIFTLIGAGLGMDVRSMSTIQTPPPMDLAVMPAKWDVGYSISIIFMWWIMMLAMMLPGAIYQLFKNQTRSPQNISKFLMEYSLVWLLFSVMISILQFTFEQLGWLDAMRMWSTNATFSISLLLFAAGYQFSSLKRNALHNCTCLNQLNRDLMTGYRYGRNCVGASTPLMLLLFVGGVMNIYWIITLTILTFVEKAVGYRKAANFFIAGLCGIAAFRF